MSYSAEDNPDWSVTTQAVRAGFERSAFGEHAEPVSYTHLTLPTIYSV